jgi:hypothetical protein
MILLFALIPVGHHVYAEIITIEIRDIESNALVPFVLYRYDQQTDHQISSTEARIDIEEGHDQLHLFPIFHQDTLIQINDLQGKSTVLIRSKYVSDQHLNYEKAHQVVDSLLKYRSRNDPELLSSFTYLALNHTTIDFDSLTQKATGIYLMPQSINKNIDQYFSRKIRIHYLEMNALSRVLFKNPKDLYEKVEKIDIQSFNKADTILEPGNLKTHSIYTNYVEMLNKKLNGILRPDYKNKYEYALLEGDRRINEKPVLILYFQPLLSRKMEGVTGYLIMEAETFAVTHLNFNYTSTESLHAHFFVEMSHVDTRVQFPAKVLHAYEIEGFPDNQLRTVIQQFIVNSNIETEIALGERNKSLNIKFLDNQGANEEDEEALWNLNKVEQVSGEEGYTYIASDSASNKKTTEKIGDYARGFYYQNLALRFLGFDLLNQFRINNYEKVRVGLGMRTSNQIWEKGRVGGYLAYGFGDKAFKYGGDLELFLDPHQYTSLKLNYFNDIREPGKTEYLQGPNDWFRNLITSRMDDYIGYEISLNFMPVKGSRMQVGMASVEIAPNYEYAFTITDPGGKSDQIKDFTIGELQIGYRFSRKELIPKTIGALLNLTSRYPTLHVNYARGLDYMFDGDFTYHKLNVRYDHYFALRQLGKTNLTIDAGIMTPDLPYSILYNGPGAKTEISLVFVNDAFQTMDLYKYTSNKYINFFFTHYFRSMFSNRKFQPEFGFAQNFGFGKFSGDTSLHQGVEINDYPRGYFESGLLINNLLKAKFWGYIYGGLGLGIFYGYGPYVSSGLNQTNVSVQVTYSLSIL